MFHKGSYDGFNLFLSGIPWTDLLKDRDAIESWEIFKSKMEEGMDKFIPKFNPKQSAGCVTNKPLWRTHRAIKAKNKKYFYWKQFQESKLNAAYVTYKKYQNRVVVEIRKAKKSFLEKAICEYKKRSKEFLCLRS